MQRPYLCDMKPNKKISIACNIFAGCSFNREIMKKTVLILTCLLATVSASAQMFIPTEKGTVLDYKYYDAKGKALRDEWRNERWLRFTVEDTWGDSIVNVAVENETLARFASSKALKDAIESLAYGDVRLTADEVIFDNMQWVIPPIPVLFNYIPEDDDQLGKYAIDRLVATSRLPRDLHVGDTLPNERFEVLFAEALSEEAMAKRREAIDKAEELIAEYGEGVEVVDLPDLMNFENRSLIRNRIVEGEEEVETPAGKWKCWKISYEALDPLMLVVGLPEHLQMNPSVTRVAIRHVDYLSPEVDLVRRDKYNGTGKRVEESMILESIKKQ